MSVRKRVVDDLDHLIHRFLFLADRQPADPGARPVVHLANPLGGFTSEVRVDAALDDWEEGLGREGGRGREKATRWFGFFNALDLL